jgi:hypothetical protein
MFTSFIINVNYTNCEIRKSITTVEYISTLNSVENVKFGHGYEIWKIREIFDIFYNISQLPNIVVLLSFG